MEKADIILYDRLVNEEILSYARPEARRIYCGKAPGVHAMTQQKIQQKLIEYAAAGHHVVRLKGGDSFVFGRGGEEALALAERGIAYEVIPGVTSAIGAGSSALIPLTHRGAAVSFACITASRKEEGGDQQEIGKLAMYVDTLVIYMGVSHISTIRNELIASGKKWIHRLLSLREGPRSRSESWLQLWISSRRLPRSMRLRIRLSLLLVRL